MTLVVRGGSAYRVLDVSDICEPVFDPATSPFIETVGGSVTQNDPEAYLRAIFEHAPIGIAIADMEGRLVHTNPALQRMLQYSEEELRNAHWSRFAHPDDIAREDELDDLIVAGEMGSYELESRRLRSDGAIIWTRQTVSEVFNAEGEALFGVAMLEDITRRKAMESALEHQARHDSLTGLPNRLLLQDRTQEAIEAARRSGSSVALLLLDLDRFKELNDTLGHHHGDLLLGQVGARLRALVRSSDTVSRLGGDEFAIVLPGTDETAAIGVAAKIRSALMAPFVLDGQGYFIDASIGIAVYSLHGSEMTTLLRHADVAMYVAKRSGSGYSVYDASQDPYQPEQLILASDLRRGIDVGELALYYQPKIDLRSGAVRGAEALARWRHPSRGLLQPDQFIPLAEHTGLINLVTQWTIREASRQQQSWHQMGVDVDVSVNISARSLQDRELVQSVTHTRHGDRGHYLPLTLELTETGIMTDPACSLDILKELHRFGARISIDDFGTGYSSLAYLKRLPVDEIKIDQSFVAEMADEDDSAVIVRSVIDLGHNLNLDVVAEGIEDEAVLRLLGTYGCDVGQGHIFSPALSPEEFLEWIERRSRANLRSIARRVS